MRSIEWKTRTGAEIGHTHITSKMMLPNDPEPLDRGHSGPVGC